MWVIVDRRTGKQVGVSGYPTSESAGQQIDAWQDRHERGGRPDITKELLLNMQPKEITE